jgi:site-specific DNA recombinase
MGGVVPLGYRIHERKLVIHDEEAATVRAIFARCVELGSVALLARSLTADGFQTRRGNPIDKAAVYKVLANRVYLGEAVHKGVAYPGEHQAIVDRKLWEKARSILQASPRVRAGRTRAETPALLKGLLYGPTGRAMSPTHTRRGNRLYRYYVSQAVLKHGPEACPVRRVPAAEIEAAVIDQLRVMLRSPEIIVSTWRAARSKIKGLSEWRGSMSVLRDWRSTSGPKASPTPSANWSASIGTSGQPLERSCGSRCCSRAGALFHPQARRPEAGPGTGWKRRCSRSAAG